MVQLQAQHFAAPAELQIYCQLHPMLWSNAATKISLLYCVDVTVAFMALLILIKSITNQYDSPNVAYYCGNAFPWYYEDGTSLNESNVMSSPLVQCLEKPQQCTTDNYYKSGITLSTGEEEEDGGVSLYSQYGYVDSSASWGVSTNPYYST
jgi:hypothetical protein